MTDPKPYTVEEARVRAAIRGPQGQGVRFVQPDRLAATLREYAAMKEAMDSIELEIDDCDNGRSVSRGLSNILAIVQRFTDGKKEGV